MPTYEYLCEACGHTFEANQRITDEPLKNCPECDGSVKRLISNGNFILKGSGWYLTDYAKSSVPAKSETKDTCGNLPACGGCPSAK